MREHPADFFIILVYTTKKNSRSGGFAILLSEIYLLRISWLLVADSVLGKQLVAYAAVKALLLLAILIVELYDGLAVER